MDSKTEQETSLNLDTFYTAEELANLRKPPEITSITVGQKYYIPNSNPGEEKELKNVLAQQKLLLDLKRAARNDKLMYAEWNTEFRRSFPDKLKGKACQHMGVTINGKVALSPQETMFLMESGRLQLKRDKLPLSSEEGYAVVLDEPMGIEKYQVYCHLARLGFIVVTHREKLGVTIYEKKINIDQCKLPTKRHNKMFDWKKKKQRLNFLGGILDNSDYAHSPAALNRAHGDSSNSAPFEGRFELSSSKLLTDEEVTSAKHDGENEGTAVNSDLSNSNLLFSLEKRTGTFDDSISANKSVNGTTFAAAHMVHSEGKPKSESILKDKMVPTVDISVTDTERMTEVSKSEKVVILNDVSASRRTSKVSSLSIDENICMTEPKIGMNPEEHNEKVVKSNESFPQLKENSLAPCSTAEKNATSENEIHSPIEANDYIKDDDSASEHIQGPYTSNQSMHEGLDNVQATDTKNDETINQAKPRCDPGIRSYRIVPLTQRLASGNNHKSSQLLVPQSTQDKELTTEPIPERKTFPPVEETVIQDSSSSSASEKRSTVEPALVDDNDSNCCIVEDDSSLDETDDDKSEDDDDSLSSDDDNSRDVVINSDDSSNAHDAEVVVVEVAKKSKQPLDIIELSSDEECVPPKDDEDDIQIIGECKKSPSSSSSSLRMTRFSNRDSSRYPLAQADRKFNNTVKWDFPNLLKKTVICLPRPPRHLLPATVSMTKEAYAIDLSMITNSGNTAPRLWNSYRDLQARSHTTIHPPFLPITQGSDSSFETSSGDIDNVSNLEPSPPLWNSLSSPVLPLPESQQSPFQRPPALLRTPSSTLGFGQQSLSGTQRLPLDDYLRMAEREAMQTAQNVFNSLTQNLNVFQGTNLSMATPGSSLFSSSATRGSSNPFESRLLNPMGRFSRLSNESRSDNKDGGQNSVRTEHLPQPEVSHAQNQAQSQDWRTMRRRPIERQVGTRFEHPYPCEMPQATGNVASWKEFKKTTGCEATDPGESDPGDENSVNPHDVLWSGTIVPLRNSQNGDFTDILKSLKLAQPANLIRGIKIDQSSTSNCTLPITFDVYLPGTVYRKRCPHIPVHRIVVIRSSNPFPSVADIVALQRKFKDDAFLQFAAVDSGNVAFYSMNEIIIPPLEKE